MKDFQQNLLMSLALALCGLCVYQWHGQSTQRNDIQKLESRIYDQAVAIQQYTNSIKTMDDQIAQMDQRLAQFKAEAKTNAQWLVKQRTELVGLRAVRASLTNALAQYGEAVTNLQTKLQTAYEGIQKQNEALKELVSQRDVLVTKYNNEVKDRNDVVNKYNELVHRLEKPQAAGAKQ
jgi:chromosome segregation ATPase